MSEVKQNDTVKVHYTGKLEDGKVFDSSADRDPLEFKVGEGKIIPGFENAVIGMNVGDSKEFKIEPDDAYGQVRNDLFEEVSKQQLPEDLEPKVGMELLSKTPDGQELRVRVSEVKDESIVIDANHPLAGEELYFEIQLVDVT